MRIVALRKESVDRNAVMGMALWAEYLSLSARRAWIEIERTRLPSFAPLVALRKESVDRNGDDIDNCPKNMKVALRKESVDRNFEGVGNEVVEGSRSPQGERG